MSDRSVTNKGYREKGRGWDLRCGSETDIRTKSLTLNREQCLIAIGHYYFIVNPAQVSNNLI